MAEWCGGSCVADLQAKLKHQMEGLNVCFGGVFSFVWLVSLFFPHIGLPLCDEKKPKPFRSSIPRLDFPKQLTFYSIFRCF